MLTSDARLDYNHSVDFTGTTSDAEFSGNEAQGMLNLQEVNNFTEVVEYSRKGQCQMDKTDKSSDGFQRFLIH